MTSLNPTLPIGFQVGEALQPPSRSSIVRRFGDGSWRRWTSWASALPNVASSNIPHELSGGLRQRVMIAIALICRPRLSDRRRANDGARRDHSSADP